MLERLSEWYTEMVAKAIASGGGLRAGHFVPERQRTAHNFGSHRSPIMCNGRSELTFLRISVEVNRMDPKRVEARVICAILGMRHDPELL